MDATPQPRPPQEPPQNRAFATGYKRHSGDMMVYGGGVLTLIGVIVSVLNGHPGPLLASLVGSASAYFYHPTLDTQRAQLGANDDGLFVARVGFIPWSAVRDVRVERRALRTLHLAHLTVLTEGPVGEAVSVPDVVPVAERFTTRNARVSGDTIRVELHTLAMAPDVIEFRLKRLQRQR